MLLILSLVPFLHLCYTSQADSIRSKDGYCVEAKGERLFRTGLGMEPCSECLPWTNLNEERPQGIDEQCWVCCYYIPAEHIRKANETITKVRSILHKYQHEDTMAVKEAHWAFGLFGAIAVLCICSLVINISQYRKIKMHEKRPDIKQAVNNSVKYDPFAGDQPSPDSPTSHHHEVHLGGEE